MSEPYDDTEDYEDCCEVCGGYIEFVTCWQCGGEGGWHDCGDDYCCCLDKDTIDISCSECGGRGRYPECTELPHTDEQMAEYRARKGIET